MSGAAALAGRAALHGGAGLVTVATPRDVAAIVAAAHPSYMTLPLHAAQGCLAASARSQLDDALQRQTSVALGPGLGQSPGVREVVRGLYADCPKPLVLDADGLNVFVGGTSLLAIHGGPRVLTPHPGEFARLTGLSAAQVQENRESLAVRFAAEHRIVLVLKGAGTIVTDGARLAINTTGGPSLATGGSGDVLTGLIASLLAQGMPAFEASQLAAHLHGRAGDLAGERLTDRYVTSVEVLGALAPAWREISSDGGNPPPR